MKATVFIPTYNGDPYLRQLLEAVFSQKLSDKYEVLIIDSGSTDKTLEIIRSFPKVRLHTIPNSEFGHGKTRNLAASMANGEFMVYLSQDAVPVNENWLSYMLEPFHINPRVVGVFGKQTPRMFADVTTKREVVSVFSSLGPDHSLMIHRKFSLYDSIENTQPLTFFSDVNSAVRRDFLLNTMPYQDVRYSEDQLLGKDILDGNYLKVYTPLGNVWHSNEYPIRDYFYRKYDEYKAMYDVLGALPPRGLHHRLRSFIIGTIKDVLFSIRDQDYSVKRKLFNILSCPLRNFGRERAAHIITDTKKRKKSGLKYSYEYRQKNRHEQ